MPALSEYSKTPVTESSNLSSEHIKKLAEYWHISEEDYVRYTEIIKGPLGRWNANIDPVLALGIYAENDVEKRKYAELYAKQEYALTRSTQAFEREYRQAFNRLYPNETIIDPQYLQAYYDHQSKKGNSYSGIGKTAAFQAGDRILYFSEMNCQRCDNDIKQLYSILNINRDVFLDIYVIDARNETEVREWAEDRRINIEWVKAGQLTLNIDNGLLARINKAGDDGLAIYLHRGESIFKIDPEQVGL